MWRAGAPSARELEAAGVARITFGSGLAKVALDAAADVAARMLA
jgi:2-methylisocitrate lyase-like PEP mutase family enzyme